ncbi:ribonuclease H-like domain-containing protein [Tanacetum coccineum]
MNENKGMMPTKIELTLEQSQQAVSNDVLVETGSIHNLSIFTKMNSDIEGRHHGHSDAMHNPSQPFEFLSIETCLISHGDTHLFSSSTTDLVAYSDVDWAGCPTTRRSTSGYCVFLCNNLLSCSSKRQSTLSRSSAEAEYRGVGNAVSETCWLRNLLRELHTPFSFATLVYCDNISVVYLSSNLVQH